MMALFNIISVFLIAQHVYAGDEPCTELGGRCQNDSLACGGQYVSGLCAGPFNRRCCVGDEACTEIEGRCQDDSLPCGGQYVSGLCAGPFSRRCCVDQDQKCRATNGTCQENNTVCTGSYVSGMCGGGINRQCCRERDEPYIGCPEVVDRATWGARPPKHVDYLLDVPAIMFIHHTHMSPCHSLNSCSAAMRAVQSLHVYGNGWYDIGYSYLVGGDGRVYEARGWNREGAHTKHYNNKSLAISFMGDFDTSEPGDVMLNTTQDMIECLVNNGMLQRGYRLMGHRQACGAQTKCPGKYLFAQIRDWPHFSDVKSDCETTSPSSEPPLDAGPPSVTWSLTLLLSLPLLYKICV